MAVEDRSQAVGGGAASRGRPLIQFDTESGYPAQTRSPSLARSCLVHQCTQHWHQCTHIDHPLITMLVLH